MTGSRGRSVIRRGLVAGEVAFALVLLVAAVLLAQSFTGLRRVEPGFRSARVLTFDISLPAAQYRSHDAVSRFHRTLATRLEAIPGVEHAAVTTDLPLASWSGCAATWVSGAVAQGQNGRCIAAINASPGFVEALGMRVAGAAPDWTSRDAQRGTALITRALAERYWPGEDPIGRKVSSYSTGPPHYEITGVIEGLRAEGLDRPEVEAIVYPVLPIQPRGTWAPPRIVSVVVRSGAGDPLSLVPAVRREMAALDPEVPISGVMTMEQVVARSISRVSLATTLIGLAAAMALVLSIVGVYGVLSYLVDQRRGEIGIRLALGASAASVRRLILRQSLVLVLAGAAAGVLGALGTTRLLGSLLFGVAPTDGPTIAGAVVLIASVAMLASWIPASRACRIDLIAALRD